MAAVILGLDRGQLGNLLEGEHGREVAGEALVRRRPGCWEADHIRALTFFPDMLPHEELE